MFREEFSFLNDSNAITNTNDLTAFSHCFLVNDPTYNAELSTGWL